MKYACHIRVAAVLTMVLAQGVQAADLTFQSASGRTVMRRGELLDVSLHFRVTAPGDASVQVWLDDDSRRLQVARQDLPHLEVGPRALTYRVDTGTIRPGKYELNVMVKSGAETERAGMPLEVVTDTPLTDFKIFHCTFPGWLLPTGDMVADSERYHFNFMLANIADTWNRGDAGPQLVGPEITCENMVRHGIDYLKYPTVYGWGLAHRPIRNGASWFDPDIREISAQLVAYHTQAGRRFPVFEGLDPIDEPDVPWSDPYMADAFKKQTGMDAPAQGDRKKDPARYLAYQVFRNHTLNDFNSAMKPYMTRVAPDAKYSCQTFADILTRSGLYPSGNTFLDVQSTHIYDHWPTSNNWMLFDTNLRRANRSVFWKMPLYVMTGCYGIAPDQWRSAWALGMSEKLEGHGYFLGAGELDENLPWAEYSLAEMLRINRTNEQYGNFFLSLNKPVQPLALWYSLSQAGASDPARNYEQEVVGAFYALKRAHFPVTIVTDEDLRAGLLDQHKVLMCVGMQDVPDDLRALLDRFRNRGGTLVKDRTTTAFAGGVTMDADFREFAGDLSEVERAWTEGRMPVSMALRRDIFAEASILRQLGQVEQTLAPLIDRPVTARSPSTFVSVQTHGAASYIFIANDAAVYEHPNEGLRWINMQESVPADDVIGMPFAKGKAIYDLFSGEVINLDKNGDVALHLPIGGLRVLCVFPRALQEPHITAREIGERTIEASAAPEHDSSGVIPAYLELRDPEGRAVLRKYLSVNQGAAADNLWRYRLAANDIPGQWRVSLRNLITHKESQAEILIKPPAASVLAEVRAAPIFDVRAFRDLARRKGLVVVPGTGCEAAAETLRAALGAEIRKPEDIRKPDILPDELDPAKQKGVWMMPRWQPLALTVGNVDVVLLGTPENNTLIKDLNESGMLRQTIYPATLGKGEGLVQYAWSPFDLGKDAAVLSGYDGTGLQAAINQFLAAAGIQTASPPPDARAFPAPLITEPLIRPAAAAILPAGPSVETIVPTWSVRLGDSIRKIASGGGIVAVGDMDSRLSVFDKAGKKLWQRTFDYRVLGVAVSPDGQWITASAFPRTYVYDRTGTLQFFSEAAVPSLDDVEGLAVRPGLEQSGSAATGDYVAGSPRLVKGTWSGKVQAYDPLGKLLWTFPAPDLTAPAAPDPAATSTAKPLPPVRTLTVLPNGTTAVGDLNELVLLDLQGKEIKRLAEARPMLLKAVGTQILMASFKKKLSLLDTTGQPVWEQSTPDFVVSADAASDGSVIAAALFGGEVRVYDALGNIKRRLRMPFDTTLTGIALDESGKFAWISTWDGDLIGAAL